MKPYQIYAEQLCDVSGNITMSFAVILYFETVTFLSFLLYHEDIFDSVTNELTL